MIRILQLIVLLAFANDLLAQTAKEQFLVVEPQGHNALVNAVMYSQLTRELITVSDDKTVRLWDLDDQALNRTFRMKSDPTGPEGMLYAGAISSDGRYVAVAGYSFYNDIKVIDLQKGDVEVVLPGHKDVVTGLAFSPDGQFLASSSADQSIIIWEKGSQYLYEKKHSLYQHQGRVNDVSFSPDGTWLVSCSDDETVGMWEVESFGDADPIRLQNHLGGVKKVATNELGFLSGDEKGIVNFWGWDGGLIDQITQFDGPVVALETSEFHNLALLSGSKQLLVNLEAPSNKIALFPSNQNVSAGYFTEDRQLMIGQGKSGNIVAIDLDQMEPVYAMRGHGLDLTQLFIKKGLLGFQLSNSSDIQAYFDFAKGQLVRDQSKLNGFRGAEVSDENFEFQKLGTDQLIFGASFSVTNTYRDGRVLSYTLLPQDRVAVGSDRTLKVYDRNGQLLKELEGHNGQVLSIVANNKEMYTYGSDQIIKVWSLGDYSLKYNLFMTRNWEWIVWANTGEYTASAGGEQYLNWQVTTPENRLAVFFPVKTHDKAFMSESIDDLAMESSRDEAKKQFQLPEKPEIRWEMPMEFQTETQQTSTRIRATVYSDQPIEKVRILVSGKAKPQQRGITDLKQVDEIIELNAYKTTVEIFASTADAKIVSEKRVFINPNYENSSNEGMTILDPSKRPNLYFFGIGVSEFANTKFNLTYADDDAEALYETFAEGNSNAYNQFEGVMLLNEEATRDNIIDRFTDLANKVKPTDQIVLFVASHGVNENGFYYVLTHDAEEGNIAGSCLRWNDIAMLLSNVPCRVLLFLDTCHSGALGANLSASEDYYKNTEALRELGSVEIGVVVMSGSTGDESSLESAEWEHGVFTLSLLEGLKQQKADIKKDGLIYLRELDFFVSNNVYELTGGKQNPTTQKPSTISKFLIY